ncbi:MAG: hypothetical protein WD896_00490 [Parcubacteria group bacterium]
MAIVITRALFLSLVALFTASEGADAFQYRQPGRCYSSGYIFGHETHLQRRGGAIVGVRRFQLYDVAWDSVNQQEYLKWFATVETTSDVVSDTLRFSDGSGALVLVRTVGLCRSFLQSPTDVFTFSDTSATP